MQREKRPTFGFFFPASCASSNVTLSNYWTVFVLSPASQGVGYTDVRALRAPGALLHLPSLCWIHLGPGSSFQPSLGSVPAPLTPQQCWLCVGIPRLYIAALSLVLSPTCSPAAPDGSSWMVLGRFSSPPMSGAIGGLCYSHCLCPPWPEPVGSTHW